MNNLYIYIWIDEIIRIVTSIGYGNHDFIHIYSTASSIACIDCIIYNTMLNNYINKYIYAYE